MAIDLFNAFREGQRAALDDKLNELMQQQKIAEARQAQEAQRASQQAAAFLGDIGAARTRAAGAGMNDAQFMADFNTQLMASPQFAALPAEVQDEVRRRLRQSTVVAAQQAAMSADPTGVTQASNALRSAGMMTPREWSPAMQAAMNGQYGEAIRLAGGTLTDDGTQVIFSDGRKMPVTAVLAQILGPTGWLGATEPINQQRAYEQALAMTQAQQAADIARINSSERYGQQATQAQLIPALAQMMTSAKPEDRPAMARLLQSMSPNMNIMPFVAPFLAPPAAAPAAATTAPAAATTAPAAGTTAPAAATTAPAAGTTAPAAGTTAPAAGTTAPAPLPPTLALIPKQVEQVSARLQALQAERTRAQNALNLLENQARVGNEDLRTRLRFRIRDLDAEQADVAKVLSQWQKAVNKATSDQQLAAILTPGSVTTDLTAISRALNQLRAQLGN